MKDLFHVWAVEGPHGTGRTKRGQKHGLKMQRTFEEIERQTAMKKTKKKRLARLGWEESEGYICTLVSEPPLFPLGNPSATSLFTSPSTSSPKWTLSHLCLSFQGNEESSWFLLSPQSLLPSLSPISVSLVPPFVLLHPFFFFCCSRSPSLFPCLRSSFSVSLSLALWISVSVSVRVSLSANT